MRPVDNFSWSADAESKRSAKAQSVNGHVCPAEKMRHDTLDGFAAAICKCVELFGEPPGLLKVSERLGCLAGRRAPPVARLMWTLLSAEYP